VAGKPAGARPAPAVVGGRRRVVVQVRPQSQRSTSCTVIPFAKMVVEHLVAVDFSESEIGVTADGAKIEARSRCWPGHNLRRIQ